MEDHPQKKQKTESSESEMSSKILKICTHSGSFHADESLAVYMLRTLSKFQGSTLVRSRDPKVWEESDIVVDVSGKYDGEKYFDHHQREFTGVFNDNFKTTLSSAGLVFKHFGKDIISENLSLDKVTNAKDIDFLYERVYKDFIEAVDANDNGISKYEDINELKPKFSDRNFQLSSIVSNLNPSWIDDATDAEFDKAFEKASEIMGLAFNNYLQYIGKSWLPARNYVERAFAERKSVHPSGAILVLDRFVPWKEHLFNIEYDNHAVGEILYILFTDSSSTWRIAATPVNSVSFDSRKKLPEPWRGVRDEELSKLTGVEGCVFIHAAGFIGGAKTKEAVLQLAKMAVEDF